MCFKHIKPRKIQCSLKSALLGNIVKYVFLALPYHIKHRKTRVFTNMGCIKTRVLRCFIWPRKLKSTYFTVFAGGRPFPLPWGLLATFVSLREHPGLLREVFLCSWGLQGASWSPFLAHGGFLETPLAHCFACPGGF